MEIEMPIEIKREIMRVWVRGTMKIGEKSASLGLSTPLPEQIRSHYAQTIRDIRRKFHFFECV
jgi:hypothetical protein